MKKFFALLLVVLMLLPAIVACGEERPEESTTPSTQNTDPSTGATSSTTGTGNSDQTGNSSQDSTKPSEGTGTSSSTNTTTSSSGNGGTVGPVEPEKEPEVVTKWSGSTLNVLATIWTGDQPSAPWSQVELTVGPNDYFSNDNFGITINSAVLNRRDFIQETYGVSINWINSRSNMIATLLSDAVIGGSESTRYHIAMPRMLEAQAIVINNSIYNVADRKYIDLDKSYYNQAAREAYTVQDKTLFVAGDFSFLDEQTSYLMYYNVAMTEGFDSFPDLYQMVRDGKWTIDQMTNVARLVTKNEGDPAWTDDDVYGFGTTSCSRFFQYSGIKQVSVKDGEYIISLNDPKVETLIDKILTISGSDWARTEWNGGYGALQKAFEEGRLLFYNEVVQKTDYFKNQTDDFKVGLLPCPKLSEAQDTYYTPCAYQSVLMCVPKATPDREMSDYFFEILSYTGQKYIMKAFKENVRSNLNAETATDSMDIVENYIFSNLCYDVGYSYGWNGLLSQVQAESYSSGKNNFTAAYTQALETASGTLEDWNLAWLDATDSI